jgi:hypothetical protein
MPTFLQVVPVPERCFLQEVLLWAAFERLPTASFCDSDGVELHESKEIYESAVDQPNIGDEYLSELECRKAGIPPDPHLKALLDGTPTLRPRHYERLLNSFDPTTSEREQIEQEKHQAIEYEAECSAWKVQYEQAVEYPASRIYIALKSGTLAAQGRLLPAAHLDEALRLLEQEDREIFDIEPSAIPSTFWSLKGIDFEKSAARSVGGHYCHITCLASEMLKVLPCERQPVEGVYRVGDSFVLDDRIEKPRANSLRGRPPYPWAEFHAEVALMIRDKTLPKKKEAAILHFQQWFLQRYGLEPSRAAVGEKLKPYYEKFAN